MLNIKDMNQVPNEFEWNFNGHQIDVIIWTTSNRMNELFILDGTNSDDLINAWSIFASSKDFEEKIIDYCRKGQRKITCILYMEKS